MMPWRVRRDFWNLLAILKYRTNRPATIPVPIDEGHRIGDVSFVSQFPGIPIHNIRVADRVPADIARERQQLLAEQLLAAESALSRLSLNQDSHEATLHAVLDLVHGCGRAYRLSEAKGRRDYNQAFFEGIFVDTEDDEAWPTVAKVNRTPVVAALQEHRAGSLAEVVDQERSSPLA